MSEYQIQDFLKLHFDKNKFRILESKVAFIVGRLRKLKRHSSKLPYVAELYALYIQTLEVFFINLLFLSGKTIDPLFITNNELRTQIKTTLNNAAFIEILMTEMVFGIKEKDKISNYEIRLKAYKNKYKIFCKDYLSDYDFLNAMKHGCRISFNTGGTVRVGDQRIFSADTTLIYFTKKNKCVYKHSILFDHKHMIVDLLYVLSMLENTVSVVNNRLLGGGRLKVTHIFPLEPYADRKARLSKPIDIGLFSESG